MELAGLVLGHPSSSDESKKRVASTIVLLKTKISNPDLQDQLSRGKGLDLEEAVRRELAH